MIANEKIIYRSPDPANIYLYTPALLEGFNGRFIAAVDLGGPGTDKLTAQSPISVTIRQATRSAFSFQMIAATHGVKPPPASP